MRFSYAVIEISIRLEMYFQTVYVGNDKDDAEKIYENCRSGVRMETWQNGVQIAVKMK